MLQDLLKGFNPMLVAKNFKSLQNWASTFRKFHLPSKHKIMSLKEIKKIIEKNRRISKGDEPKKLKLKFKK
jgi:hypothetical protein